MVRQCHAAVIDETPESGKTAAYDCRITCEIAVSWRIHTKRMGDTISAYRRSPRLAESHVVSALANKWAEIAGMIARTQQQLCQFRSGPSGRYDPPVCFRKGAGHDPGEEDLPT
jgi:hypothetical protein